MLGAWGKPPAIEDPGPEPAPELDELTESQTVAAWRLEMLIDAGYDWADATKLALSKCSWHDAARMKAQGCPDKRVLEILL